MHKLLFSAAALVLGVASANAQCITWTAPNATGGWTDFDPAPCNGETQEITDFQVFQSEAYQLEGVLAGGNYTWSQCNGAYGAWTPEYTIIAPSGAVEAFGAGTGCTITWTASEAGTYLVVINEAGACGVGGSTSNGFPAITTNSGGVACTQGPVVIDGSESFESGALPECWLAVDADGDTFNWEVTDQFLAFDGTFTAASRSWNGAILTPDNWLITPQIAVAAGDSLYFLVRGFDPGFFQENYSILVSTTGNVAPVNFTTVVFTEVLENNAWNAVSIDMSAYAGQNIYIAFRHHNVTDVNTIQLEAIHFPGINLCGVTATNDRGSLEGLNLFPNPSTGLFNVVNSGQSDNFLVQVYDMNGRMIKNERVQLNSGSQIQIDLSSEAKGVYTARFLGETLSGSILMVVK